MLAKYLCVPAFGLLVTAIRDEIELDGSLEVDEQQQPKALDLSRLIHQPRKAEALGSYDALSTEQLAHLFEDTEGPVWTGIAEQMAMHMLHEQRLKAGFPKGIENVMPSSHLELNANLSAAEEIDRTVRYGILSERQKRSLRKQHRLIRRAVGKALGYDYWGEKPKPVSYSKATQCILELGKGTDKDEIHAILADQDTTDTLGSKILGYTSQALRTTNFIGVNSTALAHFLATRLKWSLALTSFPVALPLPGITWVCEPLYQCTKDLMAVVGPLKSFLWTVIGYVVAAINWMIQAFKGLFGGDKQPVTAPEDILPQTHHIFSDSEILGNDCVKCTGKVLGRVTIDQVPPLAVQVNSVGAVFNESSGFSLSTPTLSSGANQTKDLKKCFGECLHKQMNLINRLFTGNGGADANHYFQRGNCNQHALGLCYILEKARVCHAEIDPDGNILVNPDFAQDEGLAQRSVCNALAGVKLHLGGGGDRGIFCESGKHAATMDMGHACRNVMHAIMLHNEMCEKPKPADWFSSTWQWARDATYYYYENTASLDSWDQAANKCMDLFGCHALREEMSRAPDIDRGINSFRDAMNAIARNAANGRDVKGNPIGWLDRVRNMALYQLDVFEAAAQEWAMYQQEKSRLEWIRSLDDVGAVYQQPIFEDMCFRLPRAVNDKFDGLYAKVKAANPRAHFFDALANAFRHTDWSSPQKCHIR
mmetsp:Transcript_26818/g.63877  ORF Transcript_26818/g.63877 Transcript_26818/m.63877 type:complete len:707 (+) Transcript_26818:60-2180(+)